MAAKGWTWVSIVWLRCGGRAISFALAFTLAAEHAADGGGAADPLHGGSRLQVDQVVVGLAHARVFPLVAPPEEEPGTLLKKAACSKEGRRTWHQHRQTSFCTDKKQISTLMYIMPWFR